MFRDGDDVNCSGQQLGRLHAGLGMQDVCRSSKLEVRTGVTQQGDRHASGERTSSCSATGPEHPGFIQGRGQVPKVPAKLTLQRALGRC